MSSEYSFLIETLYMTINLGCHYSCSLLLSRHIWAGITFLQSLIRICVKNGHTNFVARSQVCRKALRTSPLMSAGSSVGPAPAVFQWKFKMRGVANICWHILKWGLLQIYVNKFKNEECYYYLLTNFRIKIVTNVCWHILKWGLLQIFVDKL